MNSIFKLTSGIALAFGLLFSVPAYAAHPPVITGVWSLVANQSVGNIAINQLASAATCKPVTGNMFGNAIEGYYCPSTGRLVFARRTAAGVPFQLYQGYVSRDGAIDRIGGSFSIWNPAGGGLPNEGVDFPFLASK